MALLVAKHDQDGALVEPIDRRGSERSASSEGEQASKLTQLPAPVGGAVGSASAHRGDGTSVRWRACGRRGERRPWRSSPEATRSEQRRATAEQVRSLTTAAGKGMASRWAAVLTSAAKPGSVFRVSASLGQEVGHGEPRIAPRRHGEMIAVGPSHSAAHARCRALASGTAGIAPVRLLSRVESATNQARSSSCRWP